jgi:hypothetical protein
MAKNEQRTKMDFALKKIFVPELKSLGFKGTYPHYRIITEDSILTAMIQFSLYSRAFVIELGRSKLSGLSILAGTKPLEKLTTPYLSNRYRMGARTLHRDPWYDFENCRQESDYEKVAMLAKEQLADGISFLELAATRS